MKVRIITVGLSRRSLVSVQASIGEWTVTWPWPKAVFLSYYVLGFAKDGPMMYMFEMTVKDGVWTAVVVENLGPPGWIDQISVADFGTFYVVSTFGIDPITGGSHIHSYYRDVSADPGLDCVTAMDAASSPTFGCTCDFNGRCIGGGVYSTYSPWDTISVNGIVWSGVGTFDFDPTSDPTAGFTVVPWASYSSGTEEGRVLRVMKLGDTVAAYGDGGKMLLTPKLVGSTATFGRKELHGLGIASGNHVAGDSTLHGFIDLDGDFWLISKNGELEKLGYKEYINSLLDYTHATNDYRTLVSYLPKDKRFYISNGFECYVITEHGAYSTHQLVTSVGYTRGGSLCGFYADSGDTEARVVTDRLDFGVRGIKTIPTMEVGCYHTSGNAYAALDWRNDKTSSFQRSPWTAINPDGVATVITAGDEIRLCVKFDSYSGVELDYITPKVKITDRRYMRGPTAGRMEDITE